MDDSAGLQVSPDGRRHVCRRRSGTREDGVHTAFAQRHAAQVVQRLHHLFIAQTLRLFEIHDGRLEPGPNCRSASRPPGKTPRLRVGSVGNDFVLLRLDDDGRDHGQFAQLPSHDLRRHAVAQVGLTLLALRNGHDDDLIECRHELPRVALMPERGGSNFLACGASDTFFFGLREGGCDELREVGGG